MIGTSSYRGWQSNVYKTYLEFNTTFFINHFFLHTNKYVSKPEDMITKFIKNKEEEKDS